MPTLKILVGNRVVDAELVVHEGTLIPRVPDESLSSSMPMLTHKLEAKGQTADLLFEAGDLVQAAEKRFPELYGEDAAANASEFVKEYQLAKELYNAGSFAEAKEKASALKVRIRSEMVSFESNALVEKELKKKTKSKRVKLSRKGGKSEYQFSARFDGSRLQAKLFGTQPEKPVGELVELPAGGETMSIATLSTCSCDCNPPSIDEKGSVGWLVLVRRFKYGSLDCQDQFSFGDSTDNFKVTTCSLQENEYTYCDKIRSVFFPEE